MKAGLAGLGVVVAGGVGVVELVDHGVLPGKQELDQLDGGCSVAMPSFGFSEPGPSVSGTFFSQARHRTVGYTVAWPPGHADGDVLPLVVMLHAFGATHADALSGMTPAQALALRTGGSALPPMAMVTVDGGTGYWNPHPGDDPMATVTVDGGTGYWNPHPGDDPLAMVVDEVIPMCRQRGLGVPPATVGTMGISMGGFGALLVAERYPELVAAVAAISPAVWQDYAQARGANAGAFASAADFADDDVITHAGRLSSMPVRVASGLDDPFHPGVQALARALPPGAEVVFGHGCHTPDFFEAQVPASLEFLGRHLTA